MAIESLAQQTSTFVNSLNTKTAPSAEKTTDETSLEIRTPEQGDTVTISEAGRALVAPETSGKASKAKEESPSDKIINMLKKQIEKLEQEIEALEDSSLPKETRQKQVQAKQSELMGLREQLNEAMEAKMKAMGQTPGGGTRAEGAGNSVASF
ncbi:hypothetical protein GO013_01740 [Pseudodesulfovibrio sp. JC047]|uniref:hypothetical protein n=1 Tax=Pseudodesulfovibrio sp. JC047 TaxID=2683199 RepID=UPI0013D3255E|nr:hypothetical protein [Pseudodesulfovibrio sp. JC047]NDV18140.1 hypothetical protein [Pseudodesulfovibrio sp. JC047]